MKQVPLFRVLKVLATICLSLTILPVLMGLCASFGIRGDGSFWSGQILLLTLSSTLGLLWKTLLHPHIVKSCGLGLILANFLSALLALLFALLEMLLFFPLLPQPLQFYRLDNRFHELYFSAMGLDAVWKVLQQFHAHYTRFRMLDMRESGLFGQFYEEHREIVSLIRKGEAEELTRLIARHLEGPLDRMEAEKEKAGPPV